MIQEPYYIKTKHKFHYELNLFQPNEYIIKLLILFYNIKSCSQHRIIYYLEYKILSLPLWNRNFGFANPV